MRFPRWLVRLFTRARKHELEDIKARIAATDRAIAETHPIVEEAIRQTESSRKKLNTTNDVARRRVVRAGAFIRDLEEGWGLRHG